LNGPKLIDVCNTNLNQLIFLNIYHRPLSFDAGVVVDAFGDDVDRKSVGLISICCRVS